MSWDPSAHAVPRRAEYVGGPRDGEAVPDGVMTVTRPDGVYRLAADAFAAGACTRIHRTARRVVGAADFLWGPYGDTEPQADGDAEC